MREEIFGPVLAMMPFDSEDEATRSPMTHLTALRLYPDGSAERARRVAAASCGHDPGEWRRPCPARRLVATSSRVWVAKAASGNRGISRDQDGQRHC